MKAVVVYGTGDVRYVEYPEPQITPDAVKIRVRACGICGSDIPRVWKGGAHSYPIILGHEFAGYITEVGSNVKNLKPGDHAAGVPLIPCMTCKDCMKGNYSQCKHYSFIGSRQQGAFADYVVVPAANVVKLDSAIPYVSGAMFEPATVALHGIRISHYTGGKRVLILGGGTVGCFTLQWAKILGASRVVVVGRDKEHLTLSKDLGADFTVSTLDGNYKEQLALLSENQGFDYIYETAGSTAMMQLAFEMAANQSHVCFIGTPTSDLTFSPKLWENLNRKEMSLIGSWMSCTSPFPGTEWEMTQHFVANGKLKIDPKMIFRQFHMQAAKEAFDLFAPGGKVKGRVMLVN